MELLGEQRESIKFMKLNSFEDLDCTVKGKANTLTLQADFRQGETNFVQPHACSKMTARVRQ